MSLSGCWFSLLEPNKKNNSTQPFRNTVNLQNMSATKRFTTTEIVTYRLSNRTKVVSFDTIEEAKAHVCNEKNLHPRSKKFNSMIFDTVEKIRINGLY